RPVRRPDIGSGDSRFHERDNIAHLIRAERNRRHPQIGTAVTDYRSDEIAVLVVPDDSAANETRTMRCAIRIRAMAERARLRKLGAAALDRGVRRGLGPVRMR